MPIRLGARYSRLLGEDETRDGRAELKNMATGETASVLLTAEEIYTIIEERA